MALDEGHTDAVGNAEFNQGLSQRRAEAMRAKLARRGEHRTRNRMAKMLASEIEAALFLAEENLQCIDAATLIDAS